MTTCTKCGNQFDGAFCPSCGAPAQQPNQPASTPQSAQPPQPEARKTKFCMHCGQVIDADCVICPKCGKQVAEMGTNQPPIVINNSATATATAVVHGAGRPRNKWVAVLLCFFLGCFGGHKFYEGKAGMGILYIFTMGLFGIGVVVDLISLLLKPNPYYV